MRLEALAFEGAFKLLGSRSEDQRGSFTRLVDLGALPAWATRLSSGYLATAYNRAAGTVRGLHYQAPPHEEDKLVWCVAGSVFDVLVDMRREQPTFGTWIAETLTPDDAVSLLVPPGVAHGYQTLADDSTVAYLIRGEREPASELTLRWDDPTMAIQWPLAVREISERDRNAAMWSDLA